MTTINKNINLIQVASGLVLALSATCTLSPQIRWLGFIGVGASISTFGVASFTERRNLKILGQSIKEFKREFEEVLAKKEKALSTLKAHNENLKAFASQAEAREAKVLSEANAVSTALQERLEALDKEHSSLGLVVAKLQAKEVLVAESLDEAVQLLTESLDQWEQSLAVLLSPKRWHLFPERRQEWTDEALNSVRHWRKQISAIPKSLEGLKDFVVLYHAVYEDLTTLKTKILNSLYTREKESLQSINQRLSLELQSRIPLERYNREIAQYNARLSEFELEFGVLSEQAQMTEQELKENIDPFAQKLIDDRHRLELKVRELQLALSETNQLKPFDSVGWKSEAANRVLHCLASSDLVCDACQIPIEERNGCIEFYIQPRTYAGMRLLKSDIDKLAESLDIHLGAKGVKLLLEGKTLKVKIPVESREIKKTTSEDVLGRSLDLWSLYVGSEYHLVIFASTQSGKTSLADELNALMYTRLSGDIEFHAITLKNDGNRDDTKTQRFVVPEFKATGGEYQKALLAIHQAIAARNQVLATNPDHRFPREVFQLDEYGEYYRLGTPDEREAGKMALISLLQRGAGLSSETGKGIQMVCIAQNPQVSNLGLNRPDLANACICIVGDKNIRLFLDSDVSNHGLDEEDLERLKVELKLFKETARNASDLAMSKAKASSKDEGVAIRRCPENYYSLVIPSKAGLAPIMLYNPIPGQFTNELITVSNSVSNIELKTPICPQCGSVSRRRYRSNRYYCDNSACKTKTFTWKDVP